MRAISLLALLCVGGCDAFLPGVWCDTARNLMWQEPPASGTFTLSEAQAYCNTLQLYDHDDWRLPTIDELRSLLRGCIPSCSVSVSCPSSSSLSCADGCLDGCFTSKGPGADGCYWDPALSGSCFDYWSSTEATDAGSSGPYYWNLAFDDGTLHYINTNDLAERVRCVRSGH